MMKLFKRNTRRYDQDPPGRVLLRAFAVIAFLGLAGYIAINLVSGVPLKGYQYVEATVPNPGSLILRDPVRIGGVRVGQVQSIRTTPEGDALLELQLEPGTDLPKDSKVLVRANGLLGARFVELDRGRSKELMAAGDRIQGDDESLTFGATDVLDVFDTGTREAAQPLVGELGRGVFGRGQDANDLLRVAGDKIIPASEFFARVNRPIANQRLLPAIESLMTPLDDNRLPIAEIFGTGADALQPIPDRREATRATLVEAPPALSAADSGLSEGRNLLASARTLSAATLRTLPQAPEALDETARLLGEAPGPLGKAEDLLAAAQPAVPAALEITSSLRPVLPRAIEAFQTLLPMVRTIGPYRCDIENFGAVFRSMTGFGARGPGGPAGPPAQFRLQAASPGGLENLGVDDPGFITREGYPPPCKYLASEYPILERPVIGGQR